MSDRQFEVSNLSLGKANNYFSKISHVITVNIQQINYILSSVYTYTQQVQILIMLITLQGKTLTER